MDMFGILFIGHPDLRRILADYGFPDFPLRRDFSSSGTSQLSFSNINNVVNQTMQECSKILISQTQKNTIPQLCQSYY